LGSGRRGPRVFSRRHERSRRSRAFVRQFNMSVRAPAADNVSVEKRTSPIRGVTGTVPFALRAAQPRKRRQMSQLCVLRPYRYTRRPVERAIFVDDNKMVREWRDADGGGRQQAGGREQHRARTQQSSWQSIVPRRVAGSVSSRALQRRAVGVYIVCRCSAVKVAFCPRTPFPYTVRDLLMSPPPA